MCESWFRTWAIPGAKAKWGDRQDEAFADEQLHPAALGRASETHRSATELAAVEGLAADGGRIKMDESYASPHTGSFAYNWHTGESEEQCKARMMEVAERNYEASSHGGGGGSVASSDGGGSVLLISHGGPTSSAYRALTGREDVVRCCGFTGLFCYVRGGPDGGWEAPIVANSDHLEHAAGEKNGANDAAEQTYTPLPR